ncbi:MAG: SUMF1/EgtB/PvdO family nonheme iron enzyme [Hyphomicrobiaceae bacterium]|nr:SUMF1/EgtB/PvdO family nonheme iron enzyme [Hyphomicrobiaceae bacterium]
MARIFLSHSSIDTAEAIALRDWLLSHGWDDVFVDVDPERGIKAGQRWEEELNKAAERCKVVIFLLSANWLASEWCRAEMELALKLDKRLVPVVIDATPLTDVPEEMRSEWQVTSLIDGLRDKVVTVTLPGGDRKAAVAFASEGLSRLRIGLVDAGLDPTYFEWPPTADPSRAPYRGLKALDHDDAGIFFGRDGWIDRGLDAIRTLRSKDGSALLIVLGASGAGKSSFMRAGLVPRLAREEHRFLVLPVIRPERAVISGETGLVRSLADAVADAKLQRSRTDITAAVSGGPRTLAPLLTELIEARTATLVGARAGEQPIIVLAIDQAEELFLADGRAEAQNFLHLLGQLVAANSPPTIVVFTIRSDSYEGLQTAKQLEGLDQNTLSLPPMPQGAFAEIIRGPARRLDKSGRAKLHIEEQLVEELLKDIEASGAKDALPLLAFTLERLYREHGQDGDLTLDEYKRLGGVRGCIKAAVDAALASANGKPTIPKEHDKRLTLLKSAFIPRLASVDPETRTPRRRVARYSEIPEAARPLVELLVDQRLLLKDKAANGDSIADGETTIEPAHEALLRQWDQLDQWLRDDMAAMIALEGAKRAAKDWAGHGRTREWLAHTTGRLEAVERLRERDDLAPSLDEPTVRDYIAACRLRDNKQQRRRQVILGGLGIGLVAVVITAMINRGYLEQQFGKYSVYLPSYMPGPFRAGAKALMPAQEVALATGDSFTECQGCPEMVVLPAGSVPIGSDVNADEQPVHSVSIARPFAVSRFEVTFAQWDTCISHGGCKRWPEDQLWGRRGRPVIGVSWDDAQTYVAWLSRYTGRRYRLLTEAEWEYAARAGSATAYPWGDEVGTGNANCHGCLASWAEEGRTVVVAADGKSEAAPQFPANAFGLLHMHGNVAEWVEDCYVPSYEGAATDGAARHTWWPCTRRVVRGGSWSSGPTEIRSADRAGYEHGARNGLIGFRVARTLNASR